MEGSIPRVILEKFGGKIVEGNAYYLVVYCCFGDRLHIQETRLYAQSSLGCFVFLYIFVLVAYPLV